jgi:hypothetical protein
MRTRLGGRTKRDLVEGMIVRAPHQLAIEKTHIALETYPLFLLMLAHDFPTKLWILDRGERPSSAEILNDQIRQRRWHSRRICIDDCDGVTELIDGYVAVVVSWKTLLAVRHEFAHAVTTFFSTTVRNRLSRLYSEAKKRGDFIQPLASEGLAEYAACGLSYMFFHDLREELRIIDPDLFKVMENLLRQAEEISEIIAQPESQSQSVAGPIQ